MPQNTPRLTLQEPLGIDAPSELRLAITNHALTLDNSGLFFVGTLVNRPAAGTVGRWYLATDDTSSGSAIGTAWFDNGTTWSSAWNPPSRGASNIAGSSSTSSAGYTTMASPDQVTGIVLPTNGMIAIWHHGTWQESVGGAARAAIFIGNTQLQIANGDVGSVHTQAAGLQGGANPATNRPLTTGPGGLASHETNNAIFSDANTGQVVGFIMNNLGYTMETNGVVSVIAANSGPPWCGPTYVFADAGTYTVSIRYKTSSGTVTASNRKLWVQAVSFS